MTLPPRSTRAVGDVWSDDGRWVCSPTYYEVDTGFYGWAIYDTQTKDGLWKRVKAYPDTGQSAEEVLRDWQEDQ